ncbi:MAG: hypothetical protein KKE17_11060 [Proteobacteria bacterium]|nr:hypothetical protein [Pseudomonadota bacterium]MBU1710532.1 hypothetical protein [Pseudomonadota bacterium]
MQSAKNDTSAKDAKPDVTYGYTPKPPTCAELVKMLNGKSAEEKVALSMSVSPTPDEQCGKLAYELGMAHYKLGDKRNSREQFEKAMQDEKYQAKAYAWVNSLGER